MTDKLERIFVEVRYAEGSAKPSDVASDITSRLDGMEQEFSITENKPPRIFTAEEIENRFFDLFRAAELFKQKFLDAYGIEIEMDPRLLYVATISAYDDIERYKAYHLEKPYRDRSDAVKRSAFLTKWISKLSPFQTRFDFDDIGTKIENDTLDLDVRPALANVLFSIMVSMGHISIDCKKRTWLSADAEFHLSYDLLYRRVNEDALLATYQKIVDLVQGSEVIRH